MFYRLVFVAFCALLSGCLSSNFDPVAEKKRNDERDTAYSKRVSALKSGRKLLPRNSQGKTAFKENYLGQKLTGRQYISIKTINENPFNFGKGKLREELYCIVKSPAGDFDFDLYKDGLVLPIYGRKTPKVNLVCTGRLRPLVFATLTPSIGNYVTLRRPFDSAYHPAYELK